MSDRIAVMNRGRYEQLGEPRELYERPRTRFVASFLGASNLLHGRAAPGSDPLASVVLDETSAVRVSRDLLEGRVAVAVGVRPEKIRLLAERTDAGAMNVLSGRVRDASYAGVSTQYQVVLRNGDLVTVYEQNLARLDSGTFHRPGDEVLLAWSPADCFVVDPAASGDATEAELLGMVPASH